MSGLTDHDGHASDARFGHDFDECRSTTSICIGYDLDSCRTMITMCVWTMTSTRASDTALYLSRMFVLPMGPFADLRIPLLYPFSFTPLYNLPAILYNALATSYNLPTTIPM